MSDVPAVEDVGAAILEEIGHKIDTMRLEKLAYFAQVVYLAWYDQPLFDEEIEAYRDGPVVHRLFKMHQGLRWVRRLAKGSPDRVPDDGRCVVTFVCRLFGDTPGETLSRLTHDEGPWGPVRRAAGLRDGQWGNPVIPKELLRDYGRSKDEFMEQAWYWTPEWQAGERSAKAELERGEGAVYSSGEDFQAAL